MSGPPFYLDPAGEGWLKPNLIAGLVAAPTTEKLSPLERQMTVVLAWLVHHSRLGSRRGGPSGVQHDADVRLVACRAA
jgi:hypothetical protein